MSDYLNNINKLKEKIQTADAIVIGAGAGLSTAAGHVYSGKRFYDNFQDFSDKYGMRDMYTGAFTNFKTLEEFWGWWCRHIMVNRYDDTDFVVHKNLLSLVDKKEYFVITTNVDHIFQRAGFDKARLYYTQGDYGLMQCPTPCHQATYDNEEIVKEMYKQQVGMLIPSELIPYCPKCGEPMTTNLRKDNTFVQDEGWYKAAEAYEAFINKFKDSNILYLDLGIGYNTPAIIKYPFWRLTNYNKQATYACINLDEISVPTEIENQTIAIQGDINDAVSKLI